MRVDHRKDYQTAFERLLKFASDGPLAKEIVSAKEEFFARLGRAHEKREDLYEIATQSFLEWYCYNYQTKAFHKSPAVIYTTLAMDNEIYVQTIERALLYRWSFYEVQKVDKEWIELKDLLFLQTRKVYHERRFPEFRVWKPKVGQIIQARLFLYPDEQGYFMTHAWIHPVSETDLLKKTCEAQTQVWSAHEGLLMESIEAAARTLGLETQLSVSRASNWYYQELKRKFA